MTIYVKDLPSTKRHVLGKDSGYFPAIASAGGDHVIIVHRAGAGHMGKSGRLEAFISEDAGESWSKPVPVASDAKWDVRETGIGVTPSGTMVAAYFINKNYTDAPKGYNEAGRDFEMRVTRSRDGGWTWEPSFPFYLNVEYPGYSPYRQNVMLEDGSMLMGINGPNEHGAVQSSVLVRSADEGFTWEPWGLVAPRMNESAFLLLKDGRMLAVMRSDDYGSLYSAFGDMKTRTWTIPSVTCEGCVGTPPSLVRLSNGTILLAYGVRTGPSGARGMISADEGRTWLQDKEIIFGDNATNWDCGYANALLLPGGRLIVAYYTTAQEDPWRCDGAHCHVVVCSEKDLLDAVNL